MRLLLLAFALTVPQSQTWAGNDSRGVDQDIIRGLLVGKRSYSIENPAQISKRAAEIKQLITSGQLQDRLYSFFEQADPSQFLAKNKGTYRDFMSPQKTFETLMAENVLEDIRQTMFEVSLECKVGEVAQPATTREEKKAKVCLDPWRIASLEREVDAANSGGAPSAHDDFLFAVGVHEIARHFGLDDSHRFMVAMIDEARNQFVVADRSCSPESNLCSTGRQQYLPVFGYEYSQSPNFKVESHFKKPMSDKDFKKCTEGNLVIMGREVSAGILPPHSVKALESEAEYFLNVEEMSAESEYWNNTRAYSNSNQLRWHVFGIANRSNSEHFSEYLRSPVPFAADDEQLKCGPIHSQVYNSRGGAVGPAFNSTKSELIKFVLWKRPPGFGPIR